MGGGYHRRTLVTSLGGAVVGSESRRWFRFGERIATANQVSVEMEAVSLLAATDDGGFLVCGRDANTFAAARYGADGTRRWRETYVVGSPNRETVRSVTPLPDGGFVLAGNRDHSTATDGVDGKLVGIDPDGAERWTARIVARTPASDHAERINAVSVGSDGEVYVAGSVAGATSTSLGVEYLHHDPWVAKLQPDGTTDWVTEPAIDHFQEESPSQGIQYVEVGADGLRAITAIDQHSAEADASTEDEAAAVTVDGSGTVADQRVLDVDAWFTDVVPLEEGYLGLLRRSSGFASTSGLVRLEEDLSVDPGFQPDFPGRVRSVTPVPGEEYLVASVGDSAGTPEGYLSLVDTSGYRRWSREVGGRPIGAGALGEPTRLAVLDEHGNLSIARPESHDTVESLLWLAGGGVLVSAVGSLLGRSDR